MDDTNIISYVKPYTSVSEERIIQVLNAVKYVVDNGIEGDFAEIGVWKGGLIMAMILKLIQLGSTRTVHVYDTFCGMTEPGKNDYDYEGKYAADIFNDVVCYNTYDDTVSNINKTGYKYVSYHKDDIRKTNVNTIPKLSLLRIDTDWYELTKFELIYFEPKVTEGGIIIVDDYGHWMGCKKAVDEFLQISPQNVVKSDYTGIHWIKKHNYNETTIYDTDLEYINCLKNNMHVYTAIQNSIGVIDGCGSYMHDGWSKKYDASTQAKQSSLFQLAKNVSSVLEIGVFDGSSGLILLMGNNNIKITGIDICYNDYPEKSITVLNNFFQNRYELLKGKSSDIMPMLKTKYDLIHIDADHDYEFVCNDIENSRRLSHENTLIVFDDIDNFGVKMALERYKNEFEHISTVNCIYGHSIYKWKNKKVENIPTIVTMLFNINTYRTIEWYLDHGKNGTLDIDYPMVIFTSSDIKDSIASIRKDKGLEHITTIVECKLEDSYYYKDLEKIKKLQDSYKITNIDPAKDIPIYVVLNNSKNYFMEKAVLSNYYNTSHFVWMDFGINHTANNVKSYSTNLVNVPDKIRCMLISPYDGSPVCDYFKLIRHNVAGTLFSGKSTNLLEYFKLYRETYDNVLEEEWYQLDEAIMGLMLYKYPDLFDVYVGDYQSLITNYTNFYDCFYIAQSVLQRYLDLRNYKEAKKLLDYFHPTFSYHSKYKYWYCSNRLVCDWYLLEKKEIDSKIDSVINNLLIYDNNACKKFLIESKNILQYYIDGKKYCVNNV